MSRISCEPCVIVAPICDCCHELLCVCSKNKVIQCEDPCFPLDEIHFPGGTPLPYFVEGMVPDNDFDAALDNHAIPGPALSSTVPSGWDGRYNFFDYQFITDASTYLSAPNSYVNDISACEEENDVLVINESGLNNENLGSNINKVVNSLIKISQGNFTGYIPCGVVGGPVFPHSLDPYNEQFFYLMKSNSAFVRDSLSPQTTQFLDLINNKTVTSYEFKQKYITAIFKSILVGYFDKYFPNGKRNSILTLSQELYHNKAVPPLNVVSGEASSVNLENAKSYINENRINFKTTGAGQRYSNKILKQYWKFVPSDINLRARVYRSGQGASLFNASGIPIAGSSLPANARAWSVKVNDDDTITTYHQDGTKARAHYIDAEHLRVFNNSGAHVYLDEVPRYQEGCACCTSGCFISLCSDRDRSYVFDTMDRTVLLGLLGSVSGFSVSSFDPNPYIQFSVSAPFTSELEFKEGITTEGSSIKDFYLLTPFLSGTDTLSATVDPSTTYVKTTALEYKIIATEYGLGTQKAIDRAVRYKAGPGNVCYISNEDPLLYYLNYIDKNDLTVSAEIPDLNIRGILEGDERYPRRIPYHILVVPTDRPIKNPLFGKSEITKMVANLTAAPREDGIMRSIKFLPAPTQQELGKSYLKLTEYKDANLQNGYLPYLYKEPDVLPFGPQGTSTNPMKMEFTASDVQQTFNVWEIAGAEYSRRVDPIRKVFDFLTDVSNYYDTRTDITYEGGVYPIKISVDRVYPIIYPNSLPMFDVWRNLNLFEFHEFISSFKNEFFNELMQSKFRNLQLYYMPTAFPEKTYLHKYDPTTPKWAANGGFSGTLVNPRNASGVSFVEDALFMDQVGTRDC